MTSRAPWGALVLAVFASACGPSVIEVSPGGCPSAEPIPGESCEGAATCGYGGSPCGRSYACVDGAWVSAAPGCTPPPGACPGSLPTMGAPCKDPGQVCPFTSPGTCVSMFVATCTAGQWAVTDESPPCMPPPCPTDEPMAGAPCSFPYSCTYLVTPPGCPPETDNATCVNGAWTIQTPGTCVMP